MAKPRLFISHLSKETELARLLKRRLTRDFLGLLDVFASSDGRSIDAGSPWLDDVKSALTEARFVIVLCSSESIDRPWVNFETGAAWIRNIPVIPVCHSGMKPENLTVPLKMLQSVEASNAQGLQALYETMAKGLEMTAPSVDFAAFADEVRAFEATYIETERMRLRVLNPRILCAASRKYAGPALGFDFDVEVLEKAFPGRVVVERELTSKRLRSLLTDAKQKFDIVHLVLAVDPNTGDMYFTDTDHGQPSPAASRPDKMSAAGFADLIVETGARLVVLCTCEALFLAARVATVANMVATHVEISGATAAEWADCFYGLLAQGTPLFKADDLTSSSIPDARMVLIRHKDVEFGVRELTADGSRR